jgi:deoxyadenosine/deoxycytidine kinase
MHIAIAGNIGSGKTTLTGLLARHFGWEPHYEDVDTNPYLNSFYEDMQRWSFNLQIYFLNSRFRQVVAIRKSGKTVVQDRTIYEDANIFAPNLHVMNLMSTRDFDNYRSLFELMSSFIQPPDLLIYLRASVPTLVNQIQKRGREYENAIRLDYLKNLNEMYEDWIGQYNLGKLLIVDVDNLKFSENAEDLGNIIERINAQLHGLFTS